MNEVARIDEAQAVVVSRQVYQVTDPIPILDTARFEHMQRVATVMARSNLIPESLSSIKVNNNVVLLPLETVIANCFLIVNQAVRWNMDPFAVAQCVSIVKGKLCYEGKLIAAVIEVKLGIRLKFKWDDGIGDKLGIEVSGKFADEDEPRVISGTVGGWKTTGPGSPWGTPTQARTQLAYRGSRDWARLHSPSTMLGVYTTDEMMGLADGSHGSAAHQVTERRKAPPPPAALSKPAEPVEADAATAVTTDAQPTEPEPTAAADVVATEAKPETRRRAPPPPGVVSKPAPPIAEAAMSFNELVATFKERAQAATSVEELGAVWDEIIEPSFDRMMPGDQGDLIALNRQIAGSLPSEEG